MAISIPASAQQANTYPSKLIRIIVPFTGLTENVARLLADHVTDQTKQPVIVEAKQGASGSIAAQFVARSPGDGYTVFITTNTTQVGNPAMTRDLPYDPTKDFAPVTGVLRGWMIFAVPTSLPVQSIAELSTLARQKSLSFGYSGLGGRAAVELYKISADVNLLGVPYKSSPDALRDLLAGRIDLMSIELQSTMPLVKAGQLKPLAITSGSRLAEAPAIPTMKEAGVRDFEIGYWLAAYLPGSTPPEIVARLNQLLVAGINSEKVKNFFKTAGVEAFPTSPEELNRFQNNDAQVFQRIVRAAGMQEAK